MERRTLLGRLNWQLGEVIDAQKETARSKSLLLAVPEWIGHLPGQHVDVRLTADDGYQAERSYSIASAPGSADLELTVERIDDGEVSPWLTEDAQPGDQFELRGPVGGYFVWDASLEGPVLLVAGGSGLVPLMAILRHHENTGSSADLRLLLSARTLEDVLYRSELERFRDVVHLTLTR